MYMYMDQNVCVILLSFMERYICNYHQRVLTPTFTLTNNNYCMYMYMYTAEAQIVNIKFGKYFFCPTHQYLLLSINTLI